MLIHHPSVVKDGLVFYSDPANYKSYPAGQYSYVNNVSLLLNGEDLLDKSINAVPITVNGNVTASFSNKEIDFGGTLSDYLSASNSTLFSFSGDFTVEFWTYADSALQVNGGTIYFSTNVLDRFQLGLTSTSGIGLWLNGSLFIQGSLGSSVVGRWMHIAVVRSGTTITIYQNGTSVVSGTSSYSISTSVFYIGVQTATRFPFYGHNFDGRITNFRIVKSAIYTANFTPPSRVADPLPNRSTDLTKNRTTQTMVGSGITYSSSNGGIFTLDGTTSYGIINNNFMTIAPTSIFSACVWANYISRPTAGVARRSVLYNSVSTNDFEAILGFPYTYSSSKMGLEVGKAGVQSQTAYSLSTNNLDQWYYLVGLFKNGSADFYINGEYQSSVTYNSTVNSSTSHTKNFGIGGVFFNGTITAPYANCRVGPIQIYNKNLSANEIRQNYNATKGRFGL